MSPTTHREPADDAAGFAFDLDLGDGLNFAGCYDRAGEIDALDFGDLFGIDFGWFFADGLKGQDARGDDGEEGQGDPEEAFSSFSGHDS